MAIQIVGLEWWGLNCTICFIGCLLSPLYISALCFIRSISLLTSSSEPSDEHGCLVKAGGVESESYMYGFHEIEICFMFIFLHKLSARMLHFWRMLVFLHINRPKGARPDKAKLVMAIIFFYFRTKLIHTSQLVALENHQSALWGNNVSGNDDDA